MPPSVQPLLAAVAEADNLEPVLRQVARHFGCDDLSCTIAPRAPVPGRESLHIIASTLPPAWARVWDSNSYSEIDPRYAYWHGGGTLRFPVLWSYRKLIGQSARLDRFLNDALAHGLGSGVSFAIPDARVFASTTAWTASDAEPSPSRLAALRQNLGDMALFSYYLHAVLCPAVDAALATSKGKGPGANDFGSVPPAHGAPKPALSRRQCECLSLTASGLDLRAVAAQMRLTPAGVSAHLTTIRKALHARTTAEAVATALRLRAIT